MNKKKWTVMVYMAGDNSLSEEMITGLIGIRNAMAVPGSDKYLNILAVYDSGYPSVATTHYQFTEENSGKPLEASAVEYIHPQKHYRYRRNPTEKTYVIDFVRWAAERSPAENYALILSGHSDGVIGRTMFRDANPSTALNLSKLDYILKRSASWLVGEKKKFALLGFDSCLMNMVEVGYQLQDYADVIVASAGNVPASGWSYDTIFKSIFEKTSGLEKGLTNRHLADQIVTEFHKHGTEYNVGGRSVSISACEMSKVEPLAEYVEWLAAGLVNVLDAPISAVASGKRLDRDTLEANAVVRQRILELVHASHYYSQTYMFEQSVDIVDFVTTLSTNCDFALRELKLLLGDSPRNKCFDRLEDELARISLRCGAVKDAATKYVFSQGVSGAEYQFSQGVSIFFPWTVLAYSMLSPSYEELKLSQSLGKWMQFIRTFTKLTYRPMKSLAYAGQNILEWRGEFEKLQNDEISFRNVDDRNVDDKNVDDKNVDDKNVDDKNVDDKNVDDKNVDDKNVDDKNVDDKNVGLAEADFRNISSGEQAGFYNFFKRFRNHSINHRVSKRNNNDYDG